jgi:hypothetical protein
LATGSGLADMYSPPLTCGPHAQRGEAVAQRAGRGVLQMLLAWPGAAHTPQASWRHHPSRSATPTPVLALHTHLWRTREAAHHAHPHQLVHYEPLEVWEVDVEGVGVLGQVVLAHHRLLGLVVHGPHPPLQRHPPVRHALEPGRGHGERGAPVSRQVRSVRRHGGHSKDGVARGAHAKLDHRGLREARAVLRAAQRGQHAGPARREGVGLQGRCVRGTNGYRARAYVDACGGVKSA